jgi:8-oxo-dGTP diphosphatase
MKNNPISVVGAAIIHHGKIFIAKRATSGTNFGKWEFPGGKIEPHEHEKEALKREIREELEWAIIVGPHLSKAYATINDKNICLNIYLAELISGNLEPKLNVHSAFRWVLPEELCQYEFPEADQPAVAKIKTLDLQMAITTMPEYY